MPQLYTSGLVFINKNKILLALSKNKNAFYLPGGKTNKNETSKQTLIREIKEELSCNLKEENLKFYKHITAPAFGEKDNVIMEQDCFFYDGELNIIPSAEIEKTEWFSKTEYLQQPNIAPGVMKLFELLEEDGLLIF
ncbi:MAG: NUDIX domain-containing protein [Bacteroidetes bacterium]|nr:NUDIX domain-containing protein [Bacteroidota bacterium]MBS1649581.1 NUDIX domain-containing protein [Bacteroidota bacterium]